MICVSVSTCPDGVLSFLAAAFSDFCPGMSTTSQSRFVEKSIIKMTIVYSICGRKNRNAWRLTLRKTKEINTRKRSKHQTRLTYTAKPQTHQDVPIVLLTDFFANQTIVSKTCLYPYNIFSVAKFWWWIPHWINFLLSCKKQQKKTSLLLRVVVFRKEIMRSKSFDLKLTW